MIKDQLTWLETEVNQLKQEIQEIKESIKLDHANHNNFQDQTEIGLGKMIGRSFFKRKSKNSNITLGNIGYQLLNNSSIINNKPIFNQLFKAISYATKSSSEIPHSFTKPRR